MDQCLIFIRLLTNFIYIRIYLVYNICLLFMCAYVCMYMMYVWEMTCPGELMEVREQLCGVCSLFPSLCELQGPNLELGLSGLHRIGQKWQGPPMIVLPNGRESFCQTGLLLPW